MNEAVDAVAARLQQTSLRTTRATKQFSGPSKICPGSPRHYLGPQQVCFEPESSVFDDKNSHISERGAAILLGLSLSDLRWFSRRAGLGQIQSESNGAQLVFTYDELAKLSAISAPSAD
jgi:hypothetical protein